MTSAPTRIQYPYKVDYNDHFETPQCAYEHIMPLIDAVQPSSSRENHIIYDPFYCNGRTKVLLQSLGFTNVFHEKRDFYKDVEKDQLPNYHTFITNPPYSSDHKEKCVQFAIDRLRPKNSQKKKKKNHISKPFFILMPNYVAVRNHFRSAIKSGDSGDDPNDILYVIPPIPYEYDHPEGTGKEVSPFQSIWFCGIPSSKVAAAKKSFGKMYGDSNIGVGNIGSSMGKPRLVSTLQELRQLNAVPIQKRKNLKQRLKAKKKMQQLSEGSQSQQRDRTEGTSVTRNQSTIQQGKQKKRKGNSKYRNEDGVRKKKRF